MKQNNEETMVSRVGFDPATTNENTGFKGVMDAQQVPQVQESPTGCTKSVQSGCEKVSPVVAQILAEQAKKIEQLRAALWQARKAVKYVSDHYKPFRSELAVIDAALVETE